MNGMCPLLERGMRKTPWLGNGLQTYALLEPYNQISNKTKPRHSKTYVTFSTYDF